MADTNFITFIDITKIFDKNVVLDNLTLDIPEGEIFGVIGKSGSGKTTLLSILVGFLKPEKGKVFFKGQEVTDNYNEVLQEFGFTAQEGSFYPKLTVKENLEYFGVMYNLSKHELEIKIPKTLKLVELDGEENKPACNLSSGMQKRLDIACAILHDPKVLILDEPTEDLDPVLRKGILNLLKLINKEKKVTVIITSHLLEEMELVCTRLAILHEKKIIASGTLNELKDKKEIKKIMEKRGKLFIYSPQAEFVLRSLLQELDLRKEKILDIDLNKPSLSEVFESLIKENVQINRDNKKES